MHNVCIYYIYIVIYYYPFVKILSGVNNKCVLSEIFSVFVSAYYIDSYNVIIIVC